MKAGGLTVVPKLCKPEIDRVIIEQIEELRIQLHDMASGKDLTDEEVVNLSQQLDALLNHYNNFLLPIVG